MIAESLLVLALAATPGIPEEPIYFDPSKPIWFGIQNDGLAISRTDDLRTYGFNAGFEYDQWLVSANYSALTSLGYQYRIDLITALVGYRFEIELERDVLSLTPAVGYVMKGNFSGEYLQNEFHKVINAEPRNMPYESDDDTPFVSFTVSIDGSHNDYYHRFAMGYQQCLDEWHGFGTVLFGDHHVSCFDMYIGIRMEAHGGLDTVTEDQTASYENGLRLVYGISFRNVHLSTSYDTTKKYGSGEIVYTF